MSDPASPSLPGSADAAAAPPQPELNGLADHVAAVEAARTKLGHDLDVLSTEVRAQMGFTMEKTAWKLAATGAAVLAGVVVRKLLTAGWRKAKKLDPPTNPASPSTTWGEALAWTAASGVAVAVARMLATRGAAAGWNKAMGKLPPGLEDVVA